MLTVRFTFIKSGADFRHFDPQESNAERAKSYKSYLWYTVTTGRLFDLKCDMNWLLTFSFGGTLAADWRDCGLVIFSHLGPVYSSRLIQFFWRRHHGIWTVQKVSQLLFDFRVFSLIFFPCSPISAMFNFLKTREDTVFIAQGWSPVSVTRWSEKIAQQTFFFTFRVAV